MKNVRKAALAFVAAIGISTSAFAQVYVDVPESHWAYDAVKIITDKKWMGGNLQNEFKPNNTIDYFLFSQIAAKIAGYKDPLEYSDVSAEEKQFTQTANQTYKNVLEMYKSGFEKWKNNENFNEEIAYLLQKGVLKEADLAKFVVKQEQGEESILSLRREDMATFVVRLIGKESEALKKTGTTGFMDDEEISASAKPYVSYLKEIGVIQGGANIKFNPKDKVTKAVLAKVLSDSQGLTSTKDSNSSTKENNTSTEGKEVYIQGTVKKVYSNLYILLQYGDNEQKHYIIKKDAPILIGNKETNIATIKEGDTVLVELVKEEGQERISKLTIIDSMQENTSNTSEDTVKEPSDTTIPTTPNNLNQGNGSATDTIPPTAKRIDGIVDFVSQSGKIDIIVKYVDYKGDIKEAVETYTISQSAVITKDSKEIALSDIQRGDIIISEVKGEILYKAAIMEKQREVEGNLIEKKRENGENVLILENSRGEKTQFQISSDVMITKKGINNAVWNDLRIGDKISLDLEYDKVIGLYAEGYNSEVKGVVQEILISSTQSKITLQLANGSTKTYPLIFGAIITRARRAESITIYDVRLGQEVELYLDSLEIEEMIVKDQTKVSTIQGYIDNIDFINNYLDIRMNSELNGIKRVRLEKAVEVFQGTRRLSRRDLKEDMLVVITFNTYGSDQADIINILAD